METIKKILFIADAYHKKTKSCDFLTDYLKEFYEVEVLYYEPRELKKGFDYTKLSNEYFAVIFWQNIPRQKVFKKIKHPNIIFFPMFDAIKDWRCRFGKWNTYKNTKIVSFSSTLHKKLKRWGFNSVYVQYFIEPKEFVKGASDEIFFWQRRTKDNFNMLKKLLGDFDVKIHMHTALDPDETLIKPSAEDEQKYSITYSDWFDSRDEMNEIIKQKAIYIAPRRYEGIGMSFLEAMAMGRVVIANNKPTMNEYIKNGETGFLCDFAHPRKLRLKNIEQIQKNTYEYVKKGYKNWLVQRKTIVDFIETKPKEKWIDRFKIKSVSLRDIDCEEDLIFPDEKFFMPAQKDVFGQGHKCFYEFSSTIKPFYVRSIKNAIVKTNFEEVYVSDREVIEELTTQEINPQLGKLKFNSKKIKHIQGKVAHLSLSNLESNYGHWVLECLGRLYLIEKSKFKPDYYIISNHTTFQKQYLKLLGISQDRIIPTDSSQIIQADEIIIADFINNWELIDYRGYIHYQKRYLPGWIGNLYKEKILPKISETKKKRIYISRQKARYRTILNENELIKILKKYKFEVVNLEGMEVLKQIELFKNAECVVSVHGSGLTNCIFCPKDVKIFEIFTQYYHDSAFRVLDCAMNLSNEYMVGETSDISMHPQQENLIIDLEKFEAALLDKILVDEEKILIETQKPDITKKKSKFKINGVSIKDIDCKEELIYPEEKFLMPAQKDVFGQEHKCFCEFSSVIKPFYVRSIKNGICVTNKEEVYVSENEVIEEYTSQEKNPKIGRWKLNKFRIKRINGKVAHLSLSGLEDNYYHWLMECLGRLYLIEKSGFEPDYYVISQNKKFKKEYLELLGIPREKIIPAESNQIIQADEIIVPDFINNWRLIDFRGYIHYQKQYLPHWIENLYKERIIPKIKKGENKRIYVSRQGAKYRKILNEKEIIKLLEKYDFKIIYPEKLTILEQASFFAGADIVVSPMGAGLANMIYSDKGTKIFELCPQYFHTSCLRILSHILGLEYNYLIGQTKDTSIHPQKENMVIDKLKFEEALKFVLDNK